MAPRCPETSSFEQSSGRCGLAARKSDHSSDCHATGGAGCRHSSVSSELRPTGRYREALDSVREEALELPPDRVRRINVEIWAAAIAVRGCVPKIAALRDEMAEKCGGLDLRRVDALERYARAVTAANATYLTASRPQPRVQELTARLKEIRSVLISDLRAADRRGLVRAGCLGNLSRETGALNTLGDVLALCSFVRNNWAALEGASAIKIAEIDAAEQLTEEAHYALARKPYERSDIAKMADLRRRVFTLFFDAYDEARRGVAYLRWKQGDAEKIAPSLLRDRGRHKAEETVAAAVAPVATASLPWEESPAAEA